MTQTILQPVDLLIEARWVVPVEPHAVVLEDHAVVVDKDLIVAVLPIADARAAYSPRERVALGEHALIPGLINSHTHNPMTLLRGLADDLPLMVWLQEHIWPAEAKTRARARRVAAAGDVVVRSETFEVRTQLRRLVAAGEALDAGAQLVELARPATSSREARPSRRARSSATSSRPARPVDARAQLRRARPGRRRRRATATTSRGATCELGDLIARGETVEAGAQFIDLVAAGDVVGEARPSRRERSSATSSRPARPSRRPRSSSSSPRDASRPRRSSRPATAASSRERS